MSDSVNCWLDEFFLGSTWDAIDPSVITLFRSSDKVVDRLDSPRLPPQLQHYLEDSEDDEDLRVVYYEAPLDVIKDRLHVLGYTLDTCKKAFEAWIAAEIREKTRLMEDYAAREGNTRELADHYRDEIEALSILSPESWLQGLKTIQSNGLRQNSSLRFQGPYEGDLVRFMLSHDWYGFPGYDVCVALRLALEIHGTTGKLIYDLTDLVWAEGIELDDDVLNVDQDSFTSSYTTKAKTIVLTEGSTDAWILRESMRILYPHLVDYFSFLEFEATSVAGGVGNLANLVKAFAGAGIVNDVVALFDNDTAAAAACKSLRSLTLPPNIVIRHLPTVPFLSSYPTIGPSGRTDLDVNGIAASIELYLGEDVLTNGQGQLSPVQWTGFDRGMNQYQGEVLGKPDLHKRFRQKLEKWDGHSGPEWDGLRAVLQVISTAFDEQRGKVICGLPNDQSLR